MENAHLWIVSQLGFFNIICQDDDAEKGLLTIKARDYRDLQAVQKYITTSDIEESNITDYKYRVKARADRVASFVAMMIDHIDYPKTKPKLVEDHPERSSIYLDVWGDLLRIQESRFDTPTQVHSSS